MTFKKVDIQHLKSVALELLNELFDKGIFDYFPNSIEEAKQSEIIIIDYSFLSCVYVAKRVYETQKISCRDLFHIAVILGVINIKVTPNPSAVHPDFLDELIEKSHQFYAGMLEFREKDAKFNLELKNVQIKKFNNNLIIEMLMTKKNLTKTEAVLFAIEHDLL